MGLLRSARAAKQADAHQQMESDGTVLAQSPTSSPFHHSFVTNPTAGDVFFPSAWSRTRPNPYSPPQLILILCFCVFDSLKKKSREKYRRCTFHRGTTETLHAAVLCALWVHLQHHMRLSPPPAPRKAIKTPSRCFDLSFIYRPPFFPLALPFFFPRAHPQSPCLLLSFSVISHHYVESRKTQCSLRALHLRTNLITDTSSQVPVSFLFSFQASKTFPLLHRLPASLFAKVVVVAYR